MTLRPSNPPAITTARWPVLALNAALLLLWVILYRAVFPYLGEIFTREEFRTNQIVLAGALLLIVMQARKGGLALRLDLPPQVSGLALWLALGGSAAYLGIERFLDVNTFSATLFGLATYGLLGLWMAPRRWRAGLPAALLLVGALPFGEHMQTFVGYPVRVFTARVVQQGLAAAGVQAVGVDTILVFENGISKVDLPCSGVKSLWTGGLFWIAATWIDRRPINLRWLLAGLAFAGLLLAANLLRVAVLVAAGPVLGWNLLAELIHVPLGVLGFAAACAAAVVLLRMVGTLPEADPSSFVLTADPKGFVGQTALLSAGEPGQTLAASGEKPLGSIPFVSEADPKGFVGQTALLSAGEPGQTLAASGEKPLGSIPSVSEADPKGFVGQTAPLPASEPGQTIAASGEKPLGSIPSDSEADPKGFAGETAPRPAGEPGQTLAASGQKPLGSFSADGETSEVQPSAVKTACPLHPEAEAAPSRPAWLGPLLALSLAVMSLLYTPPPQPAAPAVPHWQLPAAMAAQAWPLTPDEQDWLAQSGVKAAERWRFTWQGQTGSILLVTSDTWRAHHRPERCFEVYGLNVEGSRTAMLAPDFPARLLTLGSRAADTRLSAAYWLQAPGKVTDDQAERIWSDFEPTRHNWVLITILYDSASDPDSDAARALYAAVRAAVALGLQGEEVP